ncbi:MAG: tetratricopeptide repeat protein [Herminiimonas sp.]|nr:tetratricopeptide repeat protein [Herminiimonas sp.]
MKRLPFGLILLGSLPLLFACSVAPTNPVGAASRVEPFVKIHHAAQSAEDFYQLGRYHEGRQSLVEARDAYRQALKIDSEHVDARSALGAIHAVQGDVDAAIAEFTLARKAAPRSAQAHNNLGYAYLLRNDTPQAIVLFEQAIALDPVGERAVNNLAEAHRQAGHPEQSVQVLALAAQRKRLQPKASESDAPMFIRDGRRSVALATGRIGDGGLPAGRDIALASPDRDAWSNTLASPDALLLKVASLLRTVGSGAIPTQAANAEMPRAGNHHSDSDSTSQTLRLRLSRALASDARSRLAAPAAEPVWTFERDRTDQEATQVLS